MEDDEEARVTSEKKKKDDDDDPEMMTTTTSASTSTLSNGNGPALLARTAGIEDYAEYYMQIGIQKLEENGKVYFSNLDTKTFLRRLVTSVVPKASHRALNEERPDFYGPLMLSFTLSLMLRLAQKGHQYQLRLAQQQQQQQQQGDQNYRGANGEDLSLLAPSSSPLNANLTTSLLITFGSLIAASLALDVAWQYVATRDRQSGSGSPLPSPGLEYALFHVGYSFFGPSIVVFLDGRVPWILFLLAFVTIGLGSSFCLGLAAFRGCGRRRGLVLGSIVFVLHALWMLLLRRSYRWG